MNQEIIQKIAAEIARQLPSHAWVLLLLQTILLLTAAALGAFLSEYLKTRGRNLATKSDFESLHRQLEVNTQLVETIKAEVGQKEWAQREWTTLRRSKLEALLLAMHDSASHLTRLRSSSFEGKSLDERDPIDELETIADLYLPELQQQVSDFSEKYRELFIRTAQMGIKVAAASTDMFARQKAFDDYNEGWGAQYKPFRLAQMALTKAARELLVEIMGVARHPLDTKPINADTKLSNRT